MATKNDKGDTAPIKRKAETRLSETSRTACGLGGIGAYMWTASS